MACIFSFHSLETPGEEIVRNKITEKNFPLQLLSANESTNKNERKDQDEMKLWLQTSLQNASKEKVGETCESPRVSYLLENVSFETRFF